MLVTSARHFWQVSKRNAAIKKLKTKYTKRQRIITLQHTALDGERQREQRPADWSYAALARVAVWLSRVCRTVIQHLVETSWLRQADPQAQSSLDYTSTTSVLLWPLNTIITDYQTSNNAALKYCIHCHSLCYYHYHHYGISSNRSTRLLLDQ